LEELRPQLSSLLPQRQAERYQAFFEKYKAEGFPEDTARQLTSLAWVAGGLGVVDVSRKAKIDLAESARRYYSLSENFSLSWLRNKLKSLVVNDKWEQIALEGLVVELRQLQLELVLGNQEFAPVEGGLVARYFTALEEVQSKGQLSLAAGDVLARMLRQMAAGAHSHDTKTRETLPALPGVQTKRR